MSARRAGAGLIVAAVVVAWGIVLLRPDNDPAALAAIAGCYSAGSEQPAISVTPDGQLHFSAQQVAVTGYRDKRGLSLKPARALVIDGWDHDRLELAPDLAALLLPYDEAHHALAIPGRHDSRETFFFRDACR